MTLATPRAFTAVGAQGAAAVAVLCGVAYCQLHGQLEGARAPVFTSLWWSVSGVLPGLVVLGQAARTAEGIRRAPLASVAVLTVAFAAAIVVGGLLYRGGGDDWAEAGFAALPMAAALAGLTVAAGRGFVRPRVATRPAPARVLFPEAPGVVVADVSLVRSSGNYLCLFARGREHWLRLPLHEAARRLGPLGFVQVHRTALVNSARIVGTRRAAGRLTLELDDGLSAPVGRAYLAEARRSSQAACASSREL